MNRETKEIITPLGQQKVILKAWITGREKRDINNAYLADTKVGKDKEIEISGNRFNAFQDRALELVVVSINGKSESLLKILLDETKSGDFAFVWKEVDNIINDSDKKK